MKNQAIQITDYDMKRLKNVLQQAQNWPKKNMKLLRKLENKLDTALVIPQKEAAPYLVTMNCHVRVSDLNQKKDMDFWLAYPDETSFGEDKVSVVSDIGIAILGAKVGAKVESANKNAKKQLQIARIHYQPEDNKHYKL